MALVQCPDCEKQVSTSAVACPHCGAPIAGAQEAKAAGTPLTTTQSTSKKLKGQKIISVLMIIIGSVWLFTLLSQEPDPESGTGLPMLITLVGVIWFVVVRFRSWWHHG